MSGRIPARHPDPDRNRRMLLARHSPGPEQHQINNEEAMQDIGRNPPRALRFDDATRIAQPGEGRVAEQGQITRGQVIPNAPSASRAIPFIGPPGPPSVISNVKRVLKRKAQAEEIAGRPGRGRLLTEAQTIQEIDSNSGCHAAPKADDLYEWSAVIEGPEDSVYKGGIFFCTIKIPNEYPFYPPQVFFHTRIYHCNINAQGEVCMDLLKDNWRSSLCIRHVLEALLALLKSCNPDDALVTPIGQQYKEDREQFEKTARLWTERYATMPQPEKKKEEMSEDE